MTQKLISCSLNVFVTYGYSLNANVKTQAYLLRPKGVTWPSVSTGVAHAHTKGTPKGSTDLWSHLVAMLLLLRKKCGEKRICAEYTSGKGHFRTGPLSVTWLYPFRSKGPSRADMAQLPVVHAQNIFPDRTASGQGLVLSCDFVTSGKKGPARSNMSQLRLHMHRTFFRTGHVTDITSRHVTDVTSGSRDFR